MFPQDPPTPYGTKPQFPDTPAVPPAQPAYHSAHDFQSPDQDSHSESDAASAPEESTELLDWKDALRHDFEAWLEDVSHIPGPEWDNEAPEAPDLFAFYSQWAAANTETRKANRRTVEAFSQWGDALGKFDGDLRLLREQLQRLEASAPTSGLSRAHALILVEMLDRMQRVSAAFGTSPSSPWWSGTAKWRKAWDSQREAFGILLGHFEALLKNEGLERLNAANQPFDPACMTAVAADPDPSRPHHTVLEEVAPGYRLRGELLRPAQVRVSTNQ